MSDGLNIPDVIDEDEFGIFADQPTRAQLPVVVAATTPDRAAAFNTMRRELVIVACANLKEYNFDFESSVVLPRARDGFTRLAAVIRRHPKSPMSIFGHADPSGSLAYNKTLSERRARAIFAILTEDVALWEALDDNHEGTNDAWGLKAVQVMVDALGFPPGNFDGTPDDATADAIGKATDTPKGPLTKAKRRVVFTRYIAFLRSGDADGFPDLDDEQFLGRGKPKGTFQGCSEFNPQFLLARKRLDEFEKGGAPGKESRDRANEPNRRVVIFFFAPGTRIDPAKWPCPLASDRDPLKGCRDRLWSTDKIRRETLFDEHARRFGKSVVPEKRQLTPPNPKAAELMGKEETTFGCRFYHGLALHSPCERDAKLWPLQLLHDVPQDVTRGPSTNPEPAPLANRRFVARLGENPDAPVIRGRTSVNGVIALPVFDDQVTIDLRVDAFAALTPPADPEAPGALDSQGFADEEQFVRLRLSGGALKRLAKRTGGPGFDAEFDGDLPEPTKEEVELGAMQRLYNLGFGSDDPGPEFGNWTPEDRKAFVTSYQLSRKLDRTGVVDDATLTQLQSDYGS